MTRFIKNENNTVSDTKTSLIWSHTLGVAKNYEEAERLVKALGPGWRLPNDEEALSIVDRSRYSPAINTEFFPDTENDYYWTSTPCAWNDAAVWVVFFYDGSVSHCNRDGDSACVRAVCSSQ